TVGPSFRVDPNLEVRVPKREATVVLPVKISWNDKATGDHVFAVFIDRAQIRPGANITSVAAGDGSCVRSAGCPDAPYLNAHAVYVTSSPALTISAVRKSLTGHRRVDRHQVTIVRLDADQRRA